MHIYVYTAIQTTEFCSLGVHMKLQYLAIWQLIYRSVTDQA